MSRNALTHDNYKTQNNALVHDDSQPVNDDNEDKHIQPQEHSQEHSQLIQAAGTMSYVTMICY
jgi:hypothetical protein